MKKQLESLLWFAIDNGPAILTIGFASYVILLAQTAAIQTDIILQWILAILGLLAVSELVERLRRIRRIEETSIKTLQAVESRFGERMSADLFFMKRLPPLGEYFEKATEIHLCGVALQRTIRENIHTFAQVLKEGADVKIVLVNPDGQAAKRIANPSANFPLDALKANTQMTMQNLSWLSALPESKGTLALHFMEEEPYYNIIAINPNKESGIIFVEIYPQRWVSGSRPRFELTSRRDAYWFGYFREQFNRLWEDSKPIPIDKPIVGN